MWTNHIRAGHNGPSLVPRIGGANILASMGYHSNPKNGGRLAASTLMYPHYATAYDHQPTRVLASE